MTALANERMSMIERWTHHKFPLTNGTKAYKGGLCVLDTTTGKVKPGVPGTTLLYIGKFDETIDATAGEKLVNVDLGMEIEVVWWNNDTVAPITAVMVGGPAYVLDDQTVSATGTGRALAGRVWLVDGLRGVAVQKISQPFAGALLEVGRAGSGPGARPGDEGDDVPPPSASPSSPNYAPPLATSPTPTTLPSPDQPTPPPSTHAPSRDAGDAPVPGKSSPMSTHMPPLRDPDDAPVPPAKPTSHPTGRK